LIKPRSFKKEMFFQPFLNSSNYFLHCIFHPSIFNLPSGENERLG
jgi:hypothetical protein